MENNTFINNVRKQLQQMTESQKDAWILTTAKLLADSAQQDFMMSLSGEKIIRYMPMLSEIEDFCRKVQNGSICIEYENHYYEFNEEGRYIDNWIVHYNDPQKAFPFINRTLEGCHDLIRLEEYDLAGEILDHIIPLKMQVVQAEESEDFYDDSPFTIPDAKKEQLLSMELREIAFDWVTTLMHGKENDGSMAFAKKLTGRLQMELCKGVALSDFHGVVSEKLLDQAEWILQKEVRELCAELKKEQDKKMDWRRRDELEQKAARIQHLLLDIRKKCRKKNDRIETPEQQSVLETSWKQVCDLFQILRYQPFIDDQLEIDEVYNICEALVERGGLGEEDWKIRKKVLKDIVSHAYYDRYSCYDPVRKLADQLVVTDAEMLEFADLLNETGCYARKAADLYRQYGRRDRYMQYLETHLYQSSAEYVELIQCYCEDGNEDEARKVAEEGLKNCKDDLTDLFLFLLKDAKKYGQTQQYKKFYASAKRRKKVHIDRIHEALQ